MTTEPWSSDVPVSMPLPPKEEAVVPMRGFAFTPSGLMPDIDAVQHRRLSIPTYAPEIPITDTEWGNDVAAPGEDVEFF